MACGASISVQTHDFQQNEIILTLLTYSLALLLHVCSGGDGNFTLSTSLSGYSRVCGGMGPMTLEGYGIFYTIESDR